MELSELIDEIKKEGKMSNETIMAYLVESIEEENEPNCIYKDLYKKAYGNKLSESICRDWVMNLDITDNSERTTGEKWSVAQTTDVGQRKGVDWNKISKYEWYACMNAFYSDFYKTAKDFEIENEADFYADLVMDYFCNDTDAHDKTPFCYYFTFVA